MHGDPALADLGHRRVHGGHRLAADNLHTYPGGRVVVEALGEADVLDADRVADAPDDALAVGGVGEAARQLSYVRRLARRQPLLLRREGHRLDAAQEFGDRGRGVDRLSGREECALFHRVEAAELDPVHAHRVGELVHLGLVGEARLYRAEAAHRAAGRVVGVEGDAVDVDVVDDVWARAQRGRVADDRRGGGGVRAAVQDDPGLEVGELAVLRGAVLVGELGRVAVDVAEEGLETVVDDLDGFAGAKGQQAGVDLHRQVLTTAERAADTRQRHPDLVLGQAEHRRDLAQVGVQPLGGDVEVDSAVLGGDRQARLGAEECLVLHAEGVLARDDEVGALASRFDIAPDDRLTVEDVRVVDVADVVVGAVVVDEDRVRRGRGGLVRDDRQFAVLDLDLGGGTARGLRVVGGDDGDRFPVVADLAVGEDRGVLDLQAVVLHVGRQVVVRHDGVDAGQCEGLGRVDRDDLGVRDRGAQDLAPQHVLVPHVRRVRELAGDLEDAVRAERGLADAALGLRALGDLGGRPEGRTLAGHVRPPLPAGPPPAGPRP